MKKIQHRPSKDRSYINKQIVLALSKSYPKLTYKEISKVVGIAESNVGVIIRTEVETQDMENMYAPFVSELKILVQAVDKSLVIDEVDSLTKKYKLFV